jgi:hypothetical protein
MAIPSSGDISTSFTASRFFSLEEIQNGPGIVSSLKYEIHLSILPREVAPTPGTFTPTEVLDGIYDTEGGGEEDSVGSPTDPGPPPEVGDQPAPKQPVRKKVYRDDVPDIEEGNQECGPVSVTRSLRWLHKKGKINLGTKTDAQLIQSFKDASDWAVAKGGVPTYKDYLSGKLSVTKDLKMVNKFMVRRPSSVPDGNYKTEDGTAINRGNHPTFDFIKKEIDDGEDIEILMGWLNDAGNRTSGHYMTVIG